MASSGSIIFTLSAFLAICVFVTLLLRHFIRLRAAPAYFLVPIFLAIALPASVVLLVPIDLCSSAGSCPNGVSLPERALLVCWRISYWLTFLLGWFILPILGDYMDSGYRDPKDRLMYSLRTNARYYLIILGCAIGGLVYIIISYGFSLTSMKSLLMALAYVWGLIFAIYLMGHGLVALPRRLLRSADLSSCLRGLQSQAPKLHEKMEDAMLELEELQAQVTQLSKRKTGTARDFREWIDELVTGNELPESRMVTDLTTSEAAQRVPAIVTERYLADLTRRLTRAHHQQARYVEEWQMLVVKASDLQKIIDSKASKRLIFSDHASSRFNLLTPNARYRLYVHVLPATSIGFGSILVLGSVCIILSEIIKWPAPQFSPVSLTVVHPPSSNSTGLGGQLTAALWILYMCTCTLSSLGDVPVWNGRALVHRNTYSESACWYALQVSKLTVPLSFNFLTFLPKHVHKDTVFFQFLGRLINLTPLGTDFDFVFPVFIFIPVCATLFNLYGKIKSVLGFEMLADEDEETNASGFGAGGWREGRDLIDRELQGGAGSLGLSPRPSSDNPRSVPVLWVPPMERDENFSERPSRPAAARSTQTPHTSRGPTIDSEPPEDDENFFQLFGKRVKNTFDTIDRPKWMQPSSPTSAGRPFNFRKPKWMGRNDVEPSSSDSGGNGALDRLFGGHSNGGQVRL